ncbi:MAG: restriction endonuclease subunit S [Nanoarchaeota archaeon]|nr:restriction endonuclease subunit S [Nanoarchaeota archaeon]
MTAQKLKQTEIGEIPEEWEVKRFDELFSITAGGDLKKEAFSSIKDDKHPFPIYSNSLTNKGLYGYSSEYTYNENCVTITARGSLGMANARDHKFNAIIRVLVLSPIQKLNCIFMSEYINNRFKFSIESTGVPQLTAPQISKYKIIYPNPEEQSAIASILSDTDGLIESLEKLIAKKKNIKQGSMQELFTGKKRLEGFNGDWEEKILGDVAEIRKGELITEETRIDGDIPVIAGGKTISYYHNKPNRIKKTITVSGSGANAGYVSFHVSPIFASDCSTIEESLNYSIEYLYFTLLLMQNKIYKMQTGGAQPHVHPKDLFSIRINIPKDPKEQSAIAQILSDMDLEIEKLERKRDKYTLLKTGMMQELLTGRIRLK